MARPPGAGAARVHPSLPPHGAHERLGDEDAGAADRVPELHAAGHTPSRRRLSSVAGRRRQMSAERVTGLLAAARRQGRRYTMRTTVLPLASGLVLIASGTLIAASAWDDADRLYWVGLIVAVGSYPLILFALPTTNGPAAAAAAAIFALFECVYVSLFVRIAVAQLRASGAGTCLGSPRVYVALSNLATASIALVTGSSFAVGLARWVVGARRGPAGAAGPRWLEPLDTRRHVDRIWRTHGLHVLGAALALGVDIVPAALTVGFGTDPVFPLMAATGVVWAALGVLMLTPAVRLRARERLATGGTGLATAAGIASLVGGADPASAIASGRKRLRAIRCDLLTRALFETNATDAVGANAWFERSVPVHVDDIDAFVSHSWHDPPEHKWEALQAWRRRFKSLNSAREPLLWIDRACIDQGDVETDLPLLPFYLAASRELLILAGPTYLERLWCVVELFTFEQMRGAVEMEEEEEEDEAEEPPSAVLGARAGRRGATGRASTESPAAERAVAAAAEGLQPTPVTPFVPPPSLAASSARPRAALGRGAMPSTVDRALMGGLGLESVSMMLLPGLEPSELAEFDAVRAQCRLRTDYDRLLGCVEAACGTLPNFNRRVRALLRGCAKYTAAEHAQRQHALGGGGGGGAVELAERSAAAESPASSSSTRPRPPGSPGWRGADAAVLARASTADTPRARALVGLRTLLLAWGPWACAWLCLLAAVALYVRHEHVQPARAACDACAASNAQLAHVGGGWLSPPEGPSEYLFSNSVHSGRGHSGRGGSGRGGSGHAAGGQLGPVHHAHAASACARLGARLALPASAAQEARLGCLVGARAMRGVWIDLVAPQGVDAANGSAWLRGADALGDAGQAAEPARALGARAYAHWAPGQPETRGGVLFPVFSADAYCAVMDGGGWLARPCSTAVEHYVCERPRRGAAGG